MSIALPSVYLLDSFLFWFRNVLTHSLIANGAVDLFPVKIPTFYERQENIFVLHFLRH